jgi:hypothetical protein
MLLPSFRRDYTTVVNDAIRRTETLKLKVQQMVLEIMDAHGVHPSDTDSRYANMPLGEPKPRSARANDTRESA